jgi:peptidoglycan hydrolase-like protein with peptidoglycan-binding domain
MRFVLVLSLMLGLATTFNVLGHGKGRETTTMLAGKSPARASQSASRAGADPMVQSDATHLAAVRRELMTRGYLQTPGAGRLDARTQAAILAFEYDHGLTLTATPGEALLKGLIFEVSRQQRVGGERPMTPAAIAFVETIQRALARVGYAKFEPTGRLDGATRSAIRAFERARGLESTGRISAALVDSLGPALAMR